MKWIKSFALGTIFVIICAVSAYLVLNLTADNTVTDQRGIVSDHTTTRLSLDLVAVGDSLTEGVGDSTQRGGYVPLVAERLREHTMVRSVKTRNYGNAGDTTTQLLALLNENGTVQSDLSNADIITLTIGGNDVVKTFSQVGLNGTLDDFEPTIQEYQNNLTTVFSTLREYNSQAPIYIFGLYNPYHYYFSELSELQAVFDIWNERTKQLTEESDNVKFVEIDSLFNPTESASDSVQERDTISEVEEIKDENHPYLYEEDLFHPNDNGYQIMAGALFDAIEQDLENQGSQFTSAGD